MRECLFWVAHWLAFLGIVLSMFFFNREYFSPAPEAPQAREIKGDILTVAVPDSIEVIVIEKQ